jgi:hypothetical protein
VRRRAGPLPRGGNAIVVTLVVLWAAAVLVGGALLVRYKSRPGDAGRAPDRWPAGSAIARDAGRPTLLMFVHPDCPCSRASLRELATLAARRVDRQSIRIVVDRSSGSGDEEAVRGLAARVMGAEVLTDDGREADRFGARTSGLVLAYDAAGALLFRGGITASRGHEGDSLGRGRLLALLDGRPTDRRDAPVFGCALADASAQAAASEGGGR